MSSKSKSRSEKQDLWAFSNTLINDSKVVNQACRLPVQPDAETIQNFVGRVSLIETRTRRSLLGKVTKKTFVLARVCKYNSETNFWVLQAYNNSGDPDGGPLDESVDDVYVLPAAGSVAHLYGTEEDQKDFTIARYCLSSQTAIYFISNTYWALSQKIWDVLNPVPCRNEGQSWIQSSSPAIFVSYTVFDF